MLFLRAVQLLTAATAVAAQTCKNVEVPVTIKASPVPFPKEVNLPTIINFLNLNFGYLLNTVSAGTYTIRGTHCTSSVESENNGRLQVLVHGILGSRYYWSALDPPSLGFEPFANGNYSHVDYALSQGYDTLAVDRLGNGRSDHPNPFAIHTPFQVEAMNQYLTSIRAGVLGTTPREIIWIGHSWGSILGSALVAKYPQALERIILTGWTAFVSKAGLTALRGMSPWPARLVKPHRFPGLALGYLHPTNELGFEALNFYAGADPGTISHYDRAAPKRVQSVVGTVAVTELVSPTFFNGVPAPSFHGKVLVVTGQHDEFFCAQSYFPGHADCGAGGSGGKGGSWGDVVDDKTYLGKSGTKVFPNAARYDYFVPANAGHGLHVHYSHRDTAAAVTEWLKETAAGEEGVFAKAAKAAKKAVGAEDVKHEEL
jgi:pimeloyl-ACP methyl ester carboxylesterase